MNKEHVNIETNKSKVPEYAIHDDKRVCGFFGPFRWLSNFFPAKVHYEGLDYPSVEYAYQAAKWPQNKRDEFTRITAGQSKRLGKKLRIWTKKNGTKIKSNLWLCWFFRNFKTTQI